MAPLKIGDRAPAFRSDPITRAQLVRYAGAGGDFNPVHFDDDAARAAGMPGVFGHGLLAAGIASRVATGWLGAANVRSFAVRFTGQFFPGDVLVGTGEVTTVRTEADEAIAECELRLARQTGEEVVRATVTARAA